MTEENREVCPTLRNLERSTFCDILRSTSMKTARRPLFLVLSLLAIFGLQLPATLWACPMTGVIGNATEVCRGTMPTSGAMPCAHLGGKCCKPFSVPPSSQTDEKHSQHSFTLANTATPSVSFVPLAASVLVVWPQTLQLSVPERKWLALSSHPPPKFTSLYRPASLAGRAPPTL